MTFFLPWIQGDVDELLDFILSHFVINGCQLGGFLLVQFQGLANREASRGKSIEICPQVSLTTVVNYIDKSVA